MDESLMTMTTCSELWLFDPGMYLHSAYQIFNLNPEMSIVLMVKEAETG